MNSAHETATLLVVDDDELNRRFVSTLLREPGYTVLLAEDGRQALDMIASRHVDIVLLDINMPVMGGIEALQQIRKRFTLLELPVIMFTAEDEAQRIAEVFNLGANDYLAKPVKPAVARARIRTQLAIARLSKLKDDFLRFASHDLKKPMLVIAEIIDSAKGLNLADTTAQQELLDFLQLIEKTNRRMQQVVYGFLDQNRLQSETEAGDRIDLNELIQEARDTNFAYAQQKRINLILDMAASLPELRLDAFKLRQVLDNLIGNAIKFCPRGASVKVRSLLHDGEVLIEVIDSGPGLRQSDYARLFQPGATLSNRPTGKETSTGIGLSLCKQLIEETGGRIGARPNPEGGAVFWFGFIIPQTQDVGSIDHTGHG